MAWTIERIVNFPPGRRWGSGYAHLGFHDLAGRQYVADFDANWVGCLGEGDRLRWSAGPTPIPESDLHIDADLKGPGYVTVTPAGRTLVACLAGNSVFDIDLEQKRSSVLINGRALGMKDVGNCEFDLDGNLWLNEVEGGRVWQFSPAGEPLQTLGAAGPGRQVDPVPFEEARFSWIFDLRRGPDGNIYVLDAMNFMVKKLDLERRVVSTVVGTGEPGYSGDGRDALSATLGGDPSEYFGGPWSLSLDEAGNIFVGDTQNHVVRMIDRATNVICTIAGRPDPVPGLRTAPTVTDPFRLNLPRICSMDYWHGRLFVPEWDGDLVVLTRDELGSGAANTRRQ